jgi:hypothetical protein
MGRRTDQSRKIGVSLAALSILIATFALFRDVLDFKLPVPEGARTEDVASSITEALNDYQIRPFISVLYPMVEAMDKRFLCTRVRYLLQP